MHIQTRLAQAGNRKDHTTGAVSVPVHHSTTFAHPGLGQSTGFDYARTINPTRKVLEDTLAELENGAKGFAFASGMAAISCVLAILKPGDHLIASNDLYGGTYRLLEQILRTNGIETSYVDTSCAERVRVALRPNTRVLFIESPTNPTMKVTDIKACCSLAKEHGLITIVDNTFMTPFLQKPLDLGADIVVHSATKYLGGHNDVLAGAAIVREDALAEHIQFLQNSMGAVLGPQDCWLLLRGIKTLALRMERHEQNAQIIAEWLTHHPYVNRVYYPGLPEHPGREIQWEQASGFGGMLSFEVTDVELIGQILSKLKLITFAESLGGVESLITYPVRQTHADIPPETRLLSGVTDTLLRLSVGIEYHADLISDLSQAFEVDSIKEVACNEI